jgi:hypothetical protein
MVLVQAAFVVAAYVAYWIIQSFIQRRRLQAFANQNGCEPPRNVSGPFPSGFARLKRIMSVQLACYLNPS